MIRRVFVFGLISFNILISLALISSPVSANDTVIDKVNITVPISCSFSDEVISTDTPHTKTIQNNDYQSEIGTTTFKTYCNDLSGYSVYAIGYSNDEYGNTLMKHSSNSNNDFNTGTDDSGNTSEWAMKLIPVSGTYAPTIQSDASGSFASYHVVPTTYTKVATFPSQTDAPVDGTPGIGSAFKSTYAAWISATQPAGTYTGKVRYTLVHPSNETPVQPQPSSPGYINYYANASTAVGTMGRQSANDGDIKTLFASNFSRSGYGFAGWSDAYDYATNPNAHFYGPNEDLTVPTGTTANGLSLYAVWVKSSGNLQGWSGCSDLTAAIYNDEGDIDESTWSISANFSNIIALTDVRDGDTYAVAKLTDDKCWMIENLRLADTHQEGENVVPTTLTMINTNNPLNDGVNVTLKHNYSDTITYPTLSASSLNWCSTNSAECDDQSMLMTDNTTNREIFQPTTNMTNHNVNLYLYGNKYNWYSATAGRGIYSKSSGITEGDLCPAGWHLPTGTGSGEFGILTNSLGGYKNASNIAQSMNTSTTPTGVIASKRIRHFPINIVYSTSRNSATNEGSYWSSSAFNNNYASFFSFAYGVMYPGNVNSKFSERTIRCIVNI